MRILTRYMPITPELAARLTLLYLRAAVPTEVSLRDGVCVVGYRTPIVTTMEAARRLAAMPKPLACYGTVTADLLVVEFRLPARWRQALTAPRKDDDDHWFRDRWGPDYRSKYVLCVGRGEWEVATFGEIAEWHATYPFLGQGGCGGSDFAALSETDRPVPPEAVSAAKARRAVVVQWYRPGVVDDGLAGRIWCTRYELEGPLPPACERCGARSARYAVHWFEGLRPARSLCQQCIDEELEVYQFDGARDLDRHRDELLRAERTMAPGELEELAEEEAMRWALLKTPPFIQDFIARYRRSDASPTDS
jgi:hypothetical protein